MSKNTILPYKWKEYVFHSGISWNFSIHSGEWTNSGKKREWQSSTNSLFSSLNPCGIDPDEEKPNEDHTVPQKVHHQTHWKHNQDAVYWIKLSMTQDQGLEFWHAKSFAIITNVTVPGNYTHRVISQNGDRVQFERLATPRQAPKNTLKSNWHTQQQQLVLNIKLRQFRASVETQETQNGKGLEKVLDRMWKQSKNNRVDRIRTEGILGNLRGW